MSQQPTSTAATPGSIDILWGVAAIATVIGRTPRQTHHLLSLGQLPARKVGGGWCASRRDLEAFFTVSKPEAA